MGPQAQKVSTQATANAQGIATFTWAQVAPPPGSVLQALAAVVSAPPAASSNVILGAVTLPAFLGANPYGPFEILPAEPFSVVSTGLVAGTVYTATLQFVAVPISEAGALPIPYASSTVNAQGIPGAAPLGISDAITFLGSETITLGTAESSFTIPGSGGAAAAGSIVEVVIHAITPFAANLFALQLFATGAGPWQTAAMQVDGTIPRPVPLSMFFRCAVQVGDQLAVNARVVTGSQQVAIFFYLHSAGLPPSILRSDGRQYPVPVNSIPWDTSSARTIINAPGAGLSILVHSITAQAEWNAGGGFAGTLDGSLGGTAVHLATAASAAANVLGVTNVRDIPPGGLLLDVNTAVTTTTPGGPTTNGVPGSLDYDVVR